MDVAGVTETMVALASTGKRLYEVAKKLSDAERKNLIADLNLHLADLKMRIVELQGENARLCGALKQKTDFQAVRENIQVQDQVYYLRESIDGRSKGPYCPRCFEADDRLVPVTAFEGALTAMGKFNCPQCKAIY